VKESTSVGLVINLTVKAKFHYASWFGPGSS